MALGLFILGGVNMSNTITFKDVSWVRKGKTILKDINFEVKEDEHWAILGLNGSGKTSTLNIITGYNFPTTGSVNVLGTQFGKGSILEMRKKIGFVSSSLNQFITTFNQQYIEGVILSGKFGSIGVYEDVSEEDEAYAHKLMDQMGLGHLKGSPFRNLSQGESRKTLIARALMAKPELMILDEPCSGLDILAREDVLDMMEVIADTDCQILYVTHYPEEITDVITHAMLIRGGEIIAQGPKKEVLTAENFEKTYDVPVSLRWEHGRPWITVER